MVGERLSVVLAAGETGLQAMTWASAVGAVNVCGGLDGDRVQGY